MTNRNLANISSMTSPRTKRVNRVTFGESPSGMPSPRLSKLDPYKKSKIALEKLIANCQRSEQDKWQIKSLMRDLRNENKLKSQAFSAVFDILHDLNDTDAKVLETLFFYKVGD